MFGNKRILTTSGDGMTPHEALAPQGWVRHCICGCTSLKIGKAKGIMTVTLEDDRQKILKEGDFISWMAMWEKSWRENGSGPSVRNILIKRFDQCWHCCGCQDYPKEWSKGHCGGSHQTCAFNASENCHVHQLILGHKQKSMQALKEFLAFQNNSITGFSCWQPQEQHHNFGDQIWLKQVLAANVKTMWQQSNAQMKHQLHQSTHNSRLHTRQWSNGSFCASIAKAKQAITMLIFFFLDCFI